MFLLLAAAACLILALLLILILRENGILGWNLHQSEVATSLGGGFGYSHPTGASPSFSHKLDIFYDGEHSSTSSVQIAGRPTIEIDVDVSPSISGNCRTPSTSRLRSSIPRPLTPWQRRIPGTGSGETLTDQPRSRSSASALAAKHSNWLETM